MCALERFFLKFLAPIPSVGVRHLGEWFSVAVIAIMGLFLFLRLPPLLLRLARSIWLSVISMSVCMRVRSAHSLPLSESV